MEDHGRASEAYCTRDRPGWLADTKDKSESVILKECLLALSAAGLGICWRQNAGKVQTSKGHWIELGPEGIADIVGILPDARIYFVECKTRTGRQREAQKRWQKAVEALGTFYVVARSGQEAVAGIHRSMIS